MLFWTDRPIAKIFSRKAPTLLKGLMSVKLEIVTVSLLKMPKRWGLLTKKVEVRQWLVFEICWS